MGRCCYCAERLELKVRKHARNYNKTACRTPAGSDRKGDNMFKKVVGTIIIEAMLSAVFIGIVIGLAM